MREANLKSDGKTPMGLSPPVGLGIKLMSKKAIWPGTKAKASITLISIKVATKLASLSCPKCRGCSQSDPIAVFNLYFLDTLRATATVGILISGML